MHSIGKVIAIVVLVSVSVFSGPSVYIAGGLNISSTSVTDSLTATKSPRTGFTIAVGFEQYLTNHISLTSGFSLETRGERTKSTTDIGDASGSIISVVESDINLFYLQIPMFVQYNVPLGPGKINLFAGPEMGIVLMGELQSVDNTTIPSTGVALPAVYDTVDVTSNMKLADGGISFGVGYEISIGNSAFFVRPSYYLGLTDYLVDDPTGKLRNIKVSGGYKFTFSK